MNNTHHHKKILTQQALWDAQHKQRGSQDGPEGSQLVNVPNHAARLLHTLLKPGSVIAEIGSANGRDARFWAKQGHYVHCLDFSEVALQQLRELAKRQGVSGRITQALFDASTGKLPQTIGTIQGFYARSALHLDDATLMRLLRDVDRRLQPGSVVVIEGKTSADPKIIRSTPLGNGLVSDPQENSHVRRVWTHEFTQYICDTFGWAPLHQAAVDETWSGTAANFLRLVATKQ